MFSQQDSEKTFIDKVLAKENVDELRELIKKKEMTREDMLEILYLISGVESKLLNYSSWDRHIVLKYFVWIREFTKIMEILYDYSDNLEKNKDQLTDRTTQLLDNIKRLLSHNCKFMIDLYLNIGRTSLSLGATGVMEILKNKYEIVYPNQQAIQTGQGNHDNRNQGKLYKVAG